jgi:hypothetical protein
MQVEYRDARSFPVDPLSDGSRIVCATRDAVADSAVSSNGHGMHAMEFEVTEELVEKAIQQLRERKLVTAPNPIPQSTRRQ